MNTDFHRSKKHSFPICVSSVSICGSPSCFFGLFMISAPSVSSAV